MPNTAIEDAVRQLKRSRRSKAILVPLIEEFYRRPVEVEDKLDRQFINQLLAVRARPRKAGVYSPSMLASCLRQVYFLKTGVKKTSVVRVESNGIFADGNWRHVKWQFALWKMHRAGIIQLIDCGTPCLGTEVYVENEKGDFGGTIDNIIYIPSVDLVTSIDWKGMNGNGFARALSSGPGGRYTTQSVGYAMLANSQFDLPKSIEKVLVLGENKNGPVNNRKVKSPLGLYEWDINVHQYRHNVASRLKKLRSYEKREEVPPPECTSTRKMMFKDCPFGPICRGEIEKIEKRRIRAFKKKDKIKFDRRRLNGKKS